MSGNAPTVAAAKRLRPSGPAEVPPPQPPGSTKARHGPRARLARRLANYLGLARGASVALLLCSAGREFSWQSWCPQLWATLPRGSPLRFLGGGSSPATPATRAAPATPVVAGTPSAPPLAPTAASLALSAAGPTKGPNRSWGARPRPWPPHSPKGATLRPPHRCRCHCQLCPRLRSFHSSRGLAMASLPRRLTLEHIRKIQRVRCVAPTLGNDDSNAQQVTHDTCRPNNALGGALRVEKLAGRPPHCGRTRENHPPKSCKVLRIERGSQNGEKI